MIEHNVEYLTTRELADLLRIKERKVYELAASGDVPCSRATGKLLFPRRAIEDWVARHSSGLEPQPLRTRPSVFLGSHDPLLEWALLESGSGLATFFDGSVDGLERFSRYEGVATALHLYVPDRDEWNGPLVATRFVAQPVVLMEFAWRERGLIVAPDGQNDIGSLADLKGRRVTPRQAGAGSQALLECLLDRYGLQPGSLTFTTTARTETDAALSVLDGRADATLGLRAVARQFRLGFVSVLRERFDLLVDRYDWFQPPMQQFAEFCCSETFAAKARALEGYDVNGLGRVHFNGAR